MSDRAPVPVPYFECEALFGELATSEGKDGPCDGSPDGVEIRGFLDLTVHPGTEQNEPDHLCINTSVDYQFEEYEGELGDHTHVTIWLDVARVRQLIEALQQFVNRA